MSKIKEGFDGNDASKPSCVRGDPISGGIRKEVSHCDDYLGVAYKNGSIQERGEALRKCENIYGDPLVGWKHICDGTPTPYVQCNNSNGYCWYAGWRCHNGRECE